MFRLSSSSQITLQPIPRVWAVVSSPADAATYGDETDSDEDGLTNLEEGLLGTDPYNGDSDFDDLDDKYEVDNDLDPLDPDLNDDGLADYLEITVEGVSDIHRDTDGDGTENIYDSDNDNDGVNDGLDLSPFSRTGVRDVFTFHIKTSGKPTYIDVALRPENTDHLTLPDKAWDWPFDDRGQMQDIDGTEEDLKCVPVLELKLDQIDDLISDEDAEAYGIFMSGGYAYVPLSQVKDGGETVALSGADVHSGIR